MSYKGGAELLQEFWATFTYDVNDPPAPSQEAATDSLQVVAPTVSDAEGDAWFVAVATLYEGFGIIVQPTYVHLVNEVDNSGETGSNALFAALAAAHGALAEEILIMNALVLEDRTAELAQIPTDISTLQTLIGGTSDELLIYTYNQGIAGLLQRQSDLQKELGI